jgi:hypothetical protein
MGRALTIRCAALLALALAAPCIAVEPAAAESASRTNAIGEAVYREGRLASGAALRGERAGALPVKGADAACARCHGRSGLGKIEGKFVIPPIAGRNLLRPGVRVIGEADLHGDPMHHLPPTPRDRQAYDDDALARAIRDGVDPGGRELDYLMPRFDIDEASMQALVGYLKRLSSGRIPGLRDGTLQLATIVTADADPVAREGMLRVLNQFVMERNELQYRTAGAPLPPGADALRFRVRRRWVLNVWELKGDPGTWERQLDEYFTRGPVFAVISGLGRSDWQPVDRFCERRAVPCLLPNIDLPGSASGNYYPIYFSQGVLLEARLMARRLGEASAKSGARRVVQIYRAGDIGRPAAARLRDALGARISVKDLELGKSVSAGDIDRALGELARGDALVLWLRPEDLAQLSAPPADLSAVFVSGLMGGLEAAPLPPGWRERALLAYPVALPAERASFLNYPLGWFHLHSIPVVAERVQVDTYIACSDLAEAVASMLDEFVPDYLVERVESSLETHLVNGYYTHLGLGPEDHFASKGGYLVRFDGPKGAKVVADGSWLVP